MLRVIAALFVLGIAVIGWVLLLPEASTKTHLAAAPAVASADAAPAPVAAPAQASRDIRVVYPGPDGTAQVRKLSDKVAVTNAAPAPVAPQTPIASDPVPEAAPAAPAKVAALAPPVSNPTSTTVAAAAEKTAVIPAPTNGQALNINTASVEALNRIPGAGLIGRTIASHRPYRSVEDLLSKRVVRKSVYDKIKTEVAAN